MKKEETIRQRNSEGYSFFRFCSKCDNRYQPVTKHRKICDSCMEKSLQRRSYRGKKQMTNIRTVIRKAKQLGIVCKVGTPKRIMLAVQKV